MLDGLPKNAALVFIAGTVLTTVLEYFTGWLLEKLFDAKWWDYSNNLCNYKGRICLVNSLLFGLLSVSLVFVLEPFTQALTARMTPPARIWLAAALTVYFAADLAVTISSMRNLNLRLEALDHAMSAVKEKLDVSNFYTALNIKERLEKLHEILDTDRGKAINASITNFRERIKQLEIDNRIFQKRIIRAFPNIRSTKYPDILNTIKDKMMIKK